MILLHIWPSIQNLIFGTFSKHPTPLQSPGYQAILGTPSGESPITPAVFSQAIDAAKRRIAWFVCLFVLLVCLVVCLFVSLLVCLVVCLFLCLFVWMFFWLFAFCLVVHLQVEGLRREIENGSTHYPETPHLKAMKKSQLLPSLKPLLYER